jgi:hypothetical protein
MSFADRERAVRDAIDTVCADFTAAPAPRAPQRLDLRQRSGAAATR